ncbi:hypothetical protein [Streptomyces spectabilis]|uniref:hypothetical protein n=1 Tax=Streptomyces spectabilis TaxID=68270 RepID=UPI0013787CD7|nr:hypothetical protein [Streptomyces spectabilis]
MSVRVLVLGGTTRRTAVADMHRLAAALRRTGMTDRYGVSVHTVPGRNGWGVYVTDRTPELGPPDGWARAVFQSSGLAA